MCMPLFCVFPRVALDRAAVLLSMKREMVRLDNVWGVGGGQRPVKHLIKEVSQCPKWADLNCLRTHTPLTGWRGWLLLLWLPTSSNRVVFINRRQESRWVVLSGPALWVLFFVLFLLCHHNSSPPGKRDWQKHGGTRTETHPGFVSADFSANAASPLSLSCSLFPN